MSKELAAMFVQSTGAATIYDAHAGQEWIGVQVNTYHFLKNCTSYREDLTLGYRAWIAENELSDCYSSIEDWIEAGCPASKTNRPKSLKPRLSPTMEGTIGVPWDRSDRGPIHDNSYNNENCLSQNFIWVLWTHDRTNYVAISIPGGYTDFVIFETDDNSGTDVTSYNCCGLYAECLSDTNQETLHWYSDNAGYNWYDSNGEPDLKDFPWVDADEFVDKDHRIKKGRNKGKLKDMVIVCRDSNYTYRVFLVWETELYEIHGSMF